MSCTRIPLGKTAKRALAALAEHGPLTLSHGVRYARISSGGIWVMASTNYLLRRSGMVEWAGGNYGRFHVRLTDYGRECLDRGSHDALRQPNPMHQSYGPRDDAALLADANSHYSGIQLAEIQRLERATTTGSERAPG